MAQRLLAAVAGSAPIDRSQLQMTASLGITIAEPTDTAETALSNADTAMYRAKQAGKGGFEIYDATMRSRLLRELALSKALATALRDNDLDVHYQPIVSLTDGRILALEALARWNHPEWGWVAPDEFIPLAEAHGLIVTLGQQLLSNAAKQATGWRATYPEALPLGIFVNMSSHQLSQPDFRQRSPAHSHSTAPPRQTSASRSPNASSSTGRRDARRQPRTTHSARRSAQPRRLRHRLLLTHGSQAPPPRRAQDRPLFHRRYPQQPGRRPHQQSHDQPRPHIRTHRHRRRRRNPTPSRLPEPARLRRSPRLSLRPTRTRAPDNHPASRRTPNPNEHATQERWRIAS